MAAPTNTTMPGRSVYLLALRIARAIAPKYGANAHDLARIMTALTLKESTWNPKAKNPKSTARGLVQMLSGTQRYVETSMLGIPSNPDAIWDPAYAMILGMTYLAYQFKRYGNWPTAIHAYMQGSYPGTNKGDGQAYQKDVRKKLQSISEDLALWDRTLQQMKNIGFATIINWHYDPPLSQPITLVA